MADETDHNSPESPEPESKKAESPSSNTQADDKAGALRVAPQTKSPLVDEGNRTEKDRNKDLREDLRYRIEIAVGVAAVLGLLTVAYQSYLTRESNSLAREAFEESKRAAQVRERPWIVFDSIELRGLPNVPGAEVSVGAMLKNVGELPAQNFRMRVSAVWLGVDERFPDSPPDVVRTGETEASIQRHSSTSVLGPGQTTRVWAASKEPLILADVIGAKARPDRLHLYGHMEYSSAGVEHYGTTFCVIVQSEGSYLTCPQYNSIY